MLARQRDISPAKAVSEQKEREREFLLPLSFCVPELVVLREHEGEAPDFVRDEPECLAAIVRGAPTVIDLYGQHVLHGGDERVDIRHPNTHRLGETVKDRAGDAIDPAGTGEGDKHSVLPRLRVGVGGNDLPKEPLRGVACVSTVNV